MLALDVSVVTSLLRTLFTLSTWVFLAFWAASLLLAQDAGDGVCLVLTQHLGYGRRGWGLLYERQMVESRGLVFGESLES